MKTDLSFLDKTRMGKGVGNLGIKEENRTYGKKGMKNCFPSSHSIFPLMISLMSITAKTRKQICLL